MADILTMAEIRSQCADEWVLLADPQASAVHEVQAGKLLFHSKDRDEVYRKAVALRPARFAVLFLGSMPPDTAVIL